MQQKRTARLVDAFLDLFTLVVRTMRRPGEAPDFDSLRDAVEELLAQAEKVAAREEISAVDFDQARFAVCAFIDETILASAWEGRKRWLQAPLQKTYYDTVNAGEEFFARLQCLNRAAPLMENEERNPRASYSSASLDREGARVDDRTAVLEVYALCLQLGFTGRYFNDREQIRLKTLRLQTLRGALPEVKWLSPELDYDKAGKALLTSEVYTAHVPAAPRKLPWDRSRFVLLALFAVPLLTVAVMYLVYDGILDLYLERFLQTVSI